MSYSTTRTTYRRANPKPRFVLWAILVFFLVFFGGSLVKKIIGGPVMAVTLPAKEAFNETAYDWGLLGYWFRSNKSLIDENLALRELAGRSRTLEAQIEMLKQERADLLMTVNRLPEKDNFAVARILTAPDQNPYDVFLIDIGKENTYINLATTSLVVSPDGVALGRLEEINDHWSKVYFFSTPGRTIPVTIGTTTVRVVIRGIGGGNFVADIPQGTEIPQGSIVRPALYPDYLLGIVEKITADPSKTFNRLLIRMPLNIFMLRQVVIYDGAS